MKACTIPLEKEPRPVEVLAEGQGNTENVVEGIDCNYKHVSLTQMRIVTIIVLCYNVNTLVHIAMFVK